MIVEVNDPQVPTSILLWVSKTLSLNQFIQQPTTKRVLYDALKVCLMYVHVVPFCEELTNAQGFQLFSFHAIFPALVT